MLLASPLSCHFAGEQAVRAAVDPCGRNPNAEALTSRSKF